MTRVLPSVHATSTTCSLCWTSLCAACFHIITRPDSQFLCTRVYFTWFSVAWDSATFWRQSNACNCSMFCTCTRSGSPYNIVHFLVYYMTYLLDPIVSPHSAQKWINYAFLSFSYMLSTVWHAWYCFLSILVFQNNYPNYIIIIPTFNLC